MTVISALKLNPTEAILVADEQVSFRGGRKADLITKVIEFSLASDFKAVVACAGSADYFDAAIPLVQANLQIVLDNNYEFARLISQSLINVRRRAIDGYVRGQLGLSEIELQSGFRIVGSDRFPISPDIIQKYNTLLTNSDIEVRALVLASKKDKIDLYTCSNNSADVGCSSQPFQVIGSGSDAAHMELTSFLESLPRNKRLDIDRGQGLTAILRATDLAVLRNIGVGGIPNIYVFSSGKLLNPSEENSHLAVEIVRASKAGYLPADFAQKALIGLVYNSASFDAVDRAVHRQIPTERRTEFSRFLRGYKH